VCNSPEESDDCGKGEIRTVILTLILSADEGEGEESPYFLVLLKGTASAVP
jgi:hypothetical protein